MKNLSRYFFGSAVAVALFFCFSFTSNASASARMPQFVLKSAVDGQKVESSSFAGKVLLVSFFATWCPPCIEEIPTFNDLQKRYDEKDFSIIALSVDQGGPEVVERLIRKKKIKYPVLMADNAVMQNFGGVYGVPVSFLVNKEGNVVKKYPGYVPKSILTKDIESIMN